MYKEHMIIVILIVWEGSQN